MTGENHHQNHAHKILPDLILVRDGNIRHQVRISFLQFCKKVLDRRKNAILFIIHKEGFYILRGKRKGMCETRLEGIKKFPIGLAVPLYDFCENRLSLLIEGEKSDIV